MSSVDSLRRFVSERLNDAAEEIFRVISKTIIEYEEEIQRQRKLLDSVSKPESKSRERGLPQQHVDEEETVPADPAVQHLSTQCQTQQQPEPPQVKEEQEEIWTSPEGPKQETDASILTPTDCENDLSEPEPRNEPIPFSINCHAADSLKQRGGRRYCLRGSKTPEVDCNMLYLRKSFKCEICGKDNDRKSRLLAHLKTHKVKKPVSPDSCETPFSHSSILNTKTEDHTKSLPDKTHGNVFHGFSGLARRISIHSTAPSASKTCHKEFGLHRNLNKPWKVQKGKSCEICGKICESHSGLKIHMRVHTGEKPYSCKVCSKVFTRSYTLRKHILTHLEGNQCKNCGKQFHHTSSLKRHMFIHLNSTNCPTALESV